MERRVGPGQYEVRRDPTEGAHSEVPARFRPGGDQVIPRPRGWRPGGAAPWDRWSRRAITAAALAEVIAHRGPGRPPAAPLAGARSSAVLVLLFDGDEGAEVVLTRRALHLSSHKGEVSFPGGRLDPGETPVQAALREANEEVLLDPATVTVVGELDHHLTMSSRALIVPIVATSEVRPVISPGTTEVDRILTVPLIEFLREDTYREEQWGDGLLERAVYFFELDDETVWGATARILVQLLALATGAEA
jgi:mutator protein MutT